MKCPFKTVNHVLLSDSPLAKALIQLHYAETRQHDCGCENMRDRTMKIESEILRQAWNTEGLSSCLQWGEQKGWPLYGPLVNTPDLDSSRLHVAKLKQSLEKPPCITFFVALGDAFSVLPTVSVWSQRFVIYPLQSPPEEKGNYS